LAQRSYFHRVAQVLGGGGESGEHVHERLPAGGLLGDDDAAFGRQMSTRSTDVQFN